MDRREFCEFEYENGVANDDEEMCRICKIQVAIYLNIDTLNNNSLEGEVPHNHIFAKLDGRHRV